MEKTEKFWKSLGNFVNVYTVLCIVSGVSSWGGAMITYINELPIWLPIILGIVSVGLLSIAIISMIIKYQHWKEIVKEQKRIIEEKRASILSLSGVMWKISHYQLEIVKSLLETGISEGLIKEIKDTLKLRLKLPMNLLPRTLVEDMETTIKLMNKRGIKIKKPQNIIKTGLIVGWILDERKVGIGISTATDSSQLYIETLNTLNSVLPKISGKELKDTITTFRTVLRSGDSAFVCKGYFVGIKSPKELIDYDTSFPEFESQRENDIQECLTEIRRLSEEECTNLQ